jgi:hypothetical protein
MHKLKILVACEYSGRVRDAFTKLGHDAWSCDILPSDIPGQHYQCDVFDVIDKGWDMMIAFPPCTYICYSGVMHLYKDPSRWQKMLDGAAFFKKLLSANIPKIAIENSVPHRYGELPKYTQIVQPYFFGDPYPKRTCLWLKNLPPLVPTNMVEPEYLIYNSKKTKSGKSKYSIYGKLGKNHGHERSITPQGLAEAMSLQWSI